MPASDVPGERLSPTQPVPSKPAPFARQSLGGDDLIDFTPAIRAAAIAKVGTLRGGPLFTPPSTQGTLVLPGWIGGAGWGATAFDSATRTLYVKATNQPSAIRLIEPGRHTATVRGRFVRDTVSPDTLAEVWIRHPESGTGARAGSNLPLLRPPYGTLTAIDLNTGAHKWEVVVGDTPWVRAHPALAGIDLPPLGVAGAPGPSLTGSGLIFLTGGGATLYGLDGANGRTLWEHDLGDGGYANPVIYQTAGGQPYVVIAVGGWPGAPGRLMAFTLP